MRNMLGCKKADLEGNMTRLISCLEDFLVIRGEEI